MVVVKAYMNKANDHVEQDFLEIVLQKMRFSLVWIGWITETVRSFSYNLLINGKFSKRIVASKGLRQGDPLPPYLFLFLVDILSKNLNKAIQSSEITGIKLNRHCPDLYHMLFVYDLLFFLEANVTNYRKLFDLIQAYCVAQGKVINYEKSSIIFSANASNEL